MISSKVIAEATGKPHPVVLKRIRKVIRSLERSNEVSKSNYEIVMNESRKLTVEIKIDYPLYVHISRDFIELWGKDNPSLMIIKLTDAYCDVPKKFGY